MNNMNELAYAMVKAYDNTWGRYEAVEQVKKIHPNTPTDTLQAMWAAIDAYTEVGKELR